MMYSPDRSALLLPSILPTLHVSGLATNILNPQTNHPDTDDSNSDKLMISPRL